MTLIEIMIVMVIMAMIAAAAGISASYFIGKARTDQTSTDARSIAAAASIHLLDDANCPSVDTLLESGILSRTGNSVDGWGQPFVIECEDGEPLVKSAGPDGSHGTEDDIDSRRRRG